MWREVVLGHRELREGDPDHEQDGYDDAPAVVGVEVGVRWGLHLCKEVGVVRQVENGRMDMNI